MDNDPVTRRDIVLLGSTGSVGTQAIDLVRRHPDRFRVVGLGAGGGTIDRLAAQAVEFGVEVVGVARPEVVGQLLAAIEAESRRVAGSGTPRPGPKVIAGPDAMAELAGRRCDPGLNAVVGAPGLAPQAKTLSAAK